MKKLLTIEDVSSILKLHRVTIQNMAISGRIPAIKVGRSWRFRRDIIDEITKQGLPPKGDSKQRMAYESY